MYSSEFIAPLLRMAGALALVLGVMLAALYFARRLKLGTGPGKGGALLNVLASRYVGTRQWILIVEAAGTPLVVGVSRDRIQLLSALDPAALSGFRDEVKRPPQPEAFAGQLRQALLKKTGNEAGEQD